MHFSPVDTSSVLRGPSEARFCQLQDITPAGATLRLAGAPPASPVLLSLELGGEHLVLPVATADPRPDGRVAVSFGGSCEQRLARLLATAA